MSEQASALNLIRETGEQVVWEMMQCEGRWYVWASNNSGDGFKFSAAGKTLTGCIKAVYRDMQSHGPAWVKS